MFSYQDWQKINIPQKEELTEAINPNHLMRTTREYMNALSQVDSRLVTSLEYTSKDNNRLSFVYKKIPVTLIFSGKTVHMEINGGYRSYNGSLDSIDTSGMKTLDAYLRTLVFKLDKIAYQQTRFN